MNFDELKREVLADWKAQADFRDAAQEEEEFVVGHQYTDEELSELDGLREPMVFNRVGTIICAVAGSEINNRTEVSYRPREIGDVKTNEVLTSGAQWFRDQADAEDEESTAFTSLITCGLGWTETLLDFDEDPEGKPAVQNTPVAEMCWDRFAKKKGLTDAKRFARVRRIPESDAKDLFPGFEMSDIDCAWIRAQDTVASVRRSLPGEEYRDNADTEREDGLVTTVQVQYRERRKVVEFVDPNTGEKTKLPKAEWEKLRKAGVPVDNVQHREFNEWAWRQSFLGNTETLRSNAPCEDCSTFRAMTGRWDSKEKRFFGLLRAMKDPQRYANRWLTQTLHIINANAKGGVMYEASAVPDPAAFEMNWAASDAAQVVVNDGALSGGAIQPKPQPALPVALMQLTEFAIAAIRDTGGVSQEMLGMREANQPGVLEYQRRQASMNTLAFYFDSLRFYRKWQGRVMLYFLVKWIAPTGRLVLIQNEGMKQYVPLATESDTLQYDVIVDDSATAPNEKERTWAVLERVLPQFAEMIPPEMWPDILEHSPLPSSLTDKFREIAERAKDQPPAPDPKMMLAEAQAKIAEQKDQRAAAKDMQDLQIEREKAAIESESMATEAYYDERAHELELRKIAAELSATFAKVDAARSMARVNGKRQ